MNWRVVVITQKCKMEYKLNYLVVKGEETIKVFLPEISTIIIENTAVAITAVLLSEIIKQKINLVFCDEKHNPLSQLVSIYGIHDSPRQINEQLSWSNEVKQNVWTSIVKEKIVKQKMILEKYNFEEYNLLNQYANEMCEGDTTNREGHAARVYFNAIFGREFNRSNEDVINSMLNYGYTILLSAFNREIVANGYLTQIGINHNNSFNYFNFSSDLMEPFRVLVDNFIINSKKEQFDSEAKHQLLDLLNKEIKIDDQKQTVKNAISIYCKSVFNALNSGNSSLIKFYEL